MEPPDVHYIRVFYEALNAIGVSDAQRDAALRAADAKHRRYWGQDLGMFATQTFARALAQEVGDPFVGLKLAMAMPEGANSVVEYAMLTAPTLRAAQRVYARYSPLLAEYISYQLHEQAGYTAVQFHAPPSVKMDPVVEDFRMARMLTGVRRALQQPDFVPTAVCFTYPRPADVAPLQQCFGKDAQLQFSRIVPAFVLRTELMDRPLATAEPVLHRILIEYAEAQLHKAEPAAKLSTRVRQLLTGKLHEGRPSFASVAKQLSMSERTLRRHLAEEGTSYGELLDEVRLSLSEALGKSSDRSGKTIARKLGFESASAFRRAQKRWLDSRSPIQGVALPATLTSSWR